MDWHIVTGEFPPSPGGVSDYTQQLAKALADASEQVHVWAPASGSEYTLDSRVKLHSLPGSFSMRWLRELDRGLAAQGEDATILVQYVPHMYGWKSMNLAFCWWLYRQRRRNLLVMFHEVAFPFRPGQPWKHSLLAVVHRLMAWMILRSARQSFTSIESYQKLLKRIGPAAKIRPLRLFSNVPFEASPDCAFEETKDRKDVVGIFSSFSSEIVDLLEQTLPAVLDNRATSVLLIGPGSGFISRFCESFPEFRDRLATSGRVNALEAGRHFHACDLLLQLYPDGAAGARGTLLAALASGVPVVTTAGPMTDPVLKSSGAIFADPSPAGIREAVNTLLADKERARRLGAATRRYYETHYDVAVAVATLREAANGAAAPRQPGRARAIYRAGSNARSSS